MGSGRFDHVAYAAFADTTKTMSTEEIYRSTTMNNLLDPKGVRVRESRDSADNPQSTPIIVALDVTGSMGILADNIARKGLGVLFEAIYDRKPVTDPHVMFMGVGDATCDHAPLQVSQFEADKRIIEQLTQLYLEHGGGGNDFESYNLPWYFAAFHTEHDSIEKRGKRGYLFTVGDEQAPGNLTNEQIKRICGDDLAQSLSSHDMLTLAQRKYDVFHIVIEEGSYARGHANAVSRSWNAVLGQRVIHLADHTKLAETIVSAIQVAEGAAAEDVAKSWGGDTEAIVQRAVKALPKGHGPALEGPR